MLIWNFSCLFVCLLHELVSCSQLRCYSCVYGAHLMAHHNIKSSCVSDLMINNYCKSYLFSTFEGPADIIWTQLQHIGHFLITNHHPPHPPAHRDTCIADNTQGFLIWQGVAQINWLLSNRSYYNSFLFMFAVSFGSHDVWSVCVEGVYVLFQWVMISVEVLNAMAGCSNW